MEIWVHEANLIAELKGDPLANQGATVCVNRLRELHPHLDVYSPSCVIYRPARNVVVLQLMGL